MIGLVSIDRYLPDKKKRITIEVKSLVVVLHVLEDKLYLSPVLHGVDVQGYHHLIVGGGRTVLHDVVLEHCFGGVQVFCQLHRSSCIHMRDAVEAIV
jgi:hypothetical protein